MSGRRRHRHAAVALVCALLGAGCSEFSVPAPPPVSSREILTDLGRWDAATTASRRAAAEDVARRLPDFALLRMETFSCGGQTHEVAIYSHSTTGLEFVLVPGGVFSMGSPESENHRSDSEAQRAVTLTKPFLIGRTECTQAAYQRVSGGNPARFQGAQFPVESVSWEESSAFCAKAGLELPTAAQWERSCRAGSTTAWSWGDDAGPLADFDWCDSPPNTQTHPVAQLRANAFGLFDMHGNVQEWCADWDPGPDDASTVGVTDPAGPPTGRYRELRSGCWTLGPREARSASRDWSDPDERADYRGFRPAKTVPSE